MNIEWMILMKKLIQSQRNWDEFNTTGHVGIVTTLFSEQYLSNSYNLLRLSNENFIEDIELNGIDTVFIDNDLFESDHEWYRKNRGNLINYLKNNNKNICVIKNTTLEVAQIFKKAFVMIVNPQIDSYLYNQFILEAPILVNQNIFNPIDSKMTSDIVYLNIGRPNKTLQKRKYNQKKELLISNLSSPKITRKILEELFKKIRNTKILYIDSTDQLDQITLKYIEYICYITTTYIIYDHKFEFDKQLFISEDFSTLNNKISMYLKNPNHLFKEIVLRQREVLINNSLLLKQNLKDFLDTKLNENITPQVSIITSTNRKENLKDYLKRMHEQKYVKLEINLVTHGFVLTEKEKLELINNADFNLNIFDMDSNMSLGNCLNLAIDNCNYPIITKVDDDDFYFENYIIDQWLALKYSGADLVGKSECFYYFESKNIIAKRNMGENQKFGDFVMGATIMTNSDTMRKIKFDNIPRAVDTNFIRRLLEGDGTLYIGHPFELCVYRSSDSTNHTWQVEDLSMLKNANIVGYGDPRSYVSLK